MTKGELYLLSAAERFIEIIKHKTKWEIQKDDAISKNLDLSRENFVLQELQDKQKKKIDCLNSIIRQNEKNIDILSKSLNITRQQIVSLI